MTIWEKQLKLNQIPYSSPPNNILNIFYYFFELIINLQPRSTIAPESDKIYNIKIYPDITTIQLGWESRYHPYF